MAPGWLVRVNPGAAAALFRWALTPGLATWRDRAWLRRRAGGADAPLASRAGEQLDVPPSCWRASPLSSAGGPVIRPPIKAIYSELMPPSC